MTERTVEEILERLVCFTNPKTRGMVITGLDKTKEKLDSLYAKKHCQIACDAVEDCIGNIGLGETAVGAIKQAFGVS